MCGGDAKYYGLFKDDMKHGMGMFEGVYGDKYFG
jgi:hypothetical protein